MTQRVRSKKSAPLIAAARPPPNEKSGLAVGAASPVPYRILKHTRKGFSIMPHDRRKRKRDDELSSSPINKSRQKRPREEIEFQTEWATDIEGRRCRTQELLRDKPNPRGPTVSEAGEKKLAEIMADLCGGQEYANLYSLIEHEWISIQQLARELSKNAGTVSKQYREEKRKLLARAISRYALNLA